jgi:hypothetical protein
MGTAGISTATDGDKRAKRLAEVMRATCPA